MGRVDFKLVGQRFKARVFTDYNRKRTVKPPCNVSLESSEFEYYTENDLI
jgi:hypothetical protein